MNKKTIASYSGYQEWYNTRNELAYRGNAKHGRFIGYVEWYSVYKATTYYIR